MRNGGDLSVEERREVESWTTSRPLPAAQVKLARMLLFLDDRLSWNSVTSQTPCSPDFIARWKPRFERDRLAGLPACPRCGQGASADLGLDPAASASRWLYSLEHAQVKQGVGGLAHDGRPRLGGAWAAAASFGVLP